MQHGTWRGYISNEKGAEEQVRDDLKSSTQIKPSSAEEWDIVRLLSVFLVDLTWVNTSIISVRK